MIPEKPVHSHVMEVVSRLQKAGYEAYVVGGAVRDLLLNLDPKDYDIATSATPEQVRGVFRRQARIIGRRFRLVHVRYGTKIYEVSTFRREPTPEERTARDDDDGVVLWRDNQYGNQEQDAFRRDYTVNAIFYNPISPGELIDYVGGLADLEEGIVRTIGEPEVRLAEDPVRILRALKLVAQYDFSLDWGLETEVRRRGGEIRLASRSRLYEELLKIFAKPYTVKTLAVFREFDFLQHFLPRVAELWDEQHGLMMRRLAAAQDQRKAGGGYWKSRRLVLATLAFCPVLESLQIADPIDVANLPRDCEKTVDQTIKELFAPLPIPNALSRNARDLIMFLPRFFSRRQINRAVKHPQYRWAHELFSLCMEVFEWDSELLHGWPPADFGPGARRRRPRQRQHGSRKKDDKRQT